LHSSYHSIRFGCRTSIGRCDASRRTRSSLCGR
jgi:hypothetical protein